MQPLWGVFRPGTGLTFTQGNGNLIDNPPLDAGEGQAMLGYDEKTIATSGSITYVKNLYLDTSGPAPKTTSWWCGILIIPILVTGMASA